MQGRSDARARPDIANPGVVGNFLLLDDRNLVALVLSVGGLRECMTIPEA
jgi:hypothetical protein